MRPLELAEADPPIETTAAADDFERGGAIVGRMPSARTQVSA
jgi:hypothetical protein